MAPTQTYTDPIHLTVRARPWSHEGLVACHVLVDGDGSISVYDDIAGHYTVCHALTTSAERRIRAAARKAVR